MEKPLIYTDYDYGRPMKKTKKHRTKAPEEKVYEHTVSYKPTMKSRPEVNTKPKQTWEQAIAGRIPAKRRRWCYTI